MNDISGKPSEIAFFTGNQFLSMIFSTAKDEKNAFHTGVLGNYLV